MKAMVQDSYGPLDAVLEVQDVEQPTIKDDEVLVRVRAASIHIGDCHGMRGAPYVMRPIFGLRRPKTRVPGTDMAGQVEAVGSGVTKFQIGDEVFGWGTGAFAEFASAPEDQLLPKPAGQTLEQASAVGCFCDHRTRGDSRRRKGPARAEGAHQRCLGRGGHVRGTNREGARRQGDRCM